MSDTSTTDLRGPTHSHGHEPLGVSVDQAARMLSVTPHFVRCLIRKGKLVSVKLGGRRLVSLKALRRMFADAEAKLGDRESNGTGGT